MTIACGVLALAGTAAAGPDDEPAPLLGGGIREVIEQGGFVMVVILVLSVVGLAFAFERLVALRSSRLVPPDLLGELDSALAEGDLDLVGEIAARADGPLPRMLAAGLRRRRHGATEIEKAMVAAGESEVEELMRPVRVLSVLANVEPLLGLLGTILGMISTFNLLATTSTANRVETLAPGIGQALYTTAAGLLVAIPFLLLFYYLSGRIGRAAARWSLLGTEVVLAAAEEQAGVGERGADAAQTTGSLGGLAGDAQA